MTELPIDQIAGIDGSAKFAVHRSGDRIDAYEYSWPDLTVRLNAMPPEELQDHLRGFMGYIASGCRNLGIATPRALLARIERVRLVLGIVVKPEMDAEGRAENVLGAIAYNSKSLIFSGGEVYDENTRKLFPPEDGRST